MGIPIGETRSGRSIEIDFGEQDMAAKLLADHPKPDDIFDVYCLILFLRLKEQHGWLLSGLGADNLFAGLARELVKASVVNAAVDSARRDKVSASAFGDVEHGRSLASPEFRIRPWL